jgi:hypothetical protein
MNSRLKFDGLNGRSMIVQTSHAHVPRTVGALMGRRVEVADGPGGQLTAVVF